MKFSKSTLAILKNFASINPGIVLTPGDVVMTRSIDNAVYAETTIDDVIDADMSIYDLNGFLGAISLVGETSSVNVENISGMNTIVIKSSKTIAYWPLDHKNSIIHPKKRIVFPTSCVEFELSSDNLAYIMKLSRGLGVDTLVITNDSGKLILNGYNKVTDGKMVKKLFTQELGEYTGDNTFKFVIDVVNLKIIQGDYKVLLWAKDKNAAVKFEGSTASYVIALNLETTHDF